MAVGVIAEYNPFHNGHIYQINKIREMFPNEEIVLVISSSFVQRGDVSIMDKWSKTRCALEYVDLVVEMPFVYTIQSADIFAYGGISILNKLGVDKIVFGSESNDIKLLERIACIQSDDSFNEILKSYLDEGNNYPTALSLSIKKMLGETTNMPNDLLGISYIKCIKNNNYNMKYYTIKRTNNYNDLETSDNILSATGIRKRIKNKEDISSYVPKCTLDNLNNEVFLDNYFSLLKYKIISSKDLSIYKLVDEGIDSRLKTYINESSSIDEFVNLVKTKRYTYNRIYRTLISILCDLTREELNDVEIDYIRVLGFNNKGKCYLNSIKKNINIEIITGYNYDSKLLNIEKRVSLIYSLGLNNSKSFLELEFSNKPIIKN